jgi:hypothetical protein
MSESVAYSLPARSPREVQQHPRHIEIVSTRSQRRARPRIVYGLIAVGGLFVILIAQLLLSIALSQGAYQISSLQVEQKNLARDQQTLTESLHVLQSPQNLSARATTLGMVMNSSSSGWLRLSDGAVLSNPSAAGSANAADTAGQALVTNVLLTPALTAAENAAMTPVAPGNPAATNGAASTSGTDGSVTSAPASTIPAPTTH